MRSINDTAKGIGLRVEHLKTLCEQPVREDIDFLELAPENWMDIGGAKRECLEQLSAKYPLVAHGLSLSIGDAEPLNIEFVKRVRDFLDQYNIGIYSEHLSLSRDQQGYLYDLIPTPRHRENIPYLAERIKQVQDIIQRPLVLENISYYHRYDNEMPEAEFLSEVVEQSQCELLLDINNLYVNSQNHDYDPTTLFKALPSQAIRYFHIAGHLECEDDFLLDTHGKAVTDNVVQLARQVMEYHGSRPLLLERDHHVPALDELSHELTSIQDAIGVY
ncbi:DUF692 domain-containing protein [Endozoicomonas numazuensis]|uniref:Uncharacterized protein n=1 Tax=Endozoicomonas numazuensis TaxID=1137799 RepID=A0A081NHI8_9GAMM|nr:DUF692 domain-containing protein [Endozoicomonas numazuensis]KEQ17911.1 hypothetical protein GZ78_09770 [Endozoicomonas numazuensis]